MSADDLNVTIPVRTLVDHLNCPVCMCQLRQTHTTPCGHRFCEECIKESINIHHKCPCCNQPLNIGQLIRDHQFDDVIGQINIERDKAEKRYFEELINTASHQVEPLAHGSTEDTPQSHDAECRKHFSPVEDVLKKHLKQSLLAHQRYYQDIIDSFKRRLEQTDAECQRMIDELHYQGLVQEELARQTEDLLKTYDRKKESLQEEMNHCASLIAGAYDRYLEEHIPSMSILPVKVSINVLAKNIRIPDVELRPQDGLEEVRAIIESHIERNGDKVIRYGADSTFICFGPFSQKNTYEMLQIASDLVEVGATNPDIFILPERCKPVLQFSLKPGSELALYGQLQCESDLPKKCFAATFNPAEPVKVDYFSCKDCGFNWICRSCMDVCHKDHCVVPYIMNHQPTWACCYCPKKKKCVIKENK